ncbi:MAG: hypothetical protein U0002_19020 [Thermoanaerobaculia bacterium]
MRATCLWLTALALVAAVPALAADRAIQNGIDLWHTPPDGSTYVDFAKTPVPAGFFCAGSAPFTGRVVLEGVPLVTGANTQLGNTDTIVQRLDDAVFNKRDVAFTRVQMRALSLKSVNPIDTACGQYNLTVGIDGQQPITRMKIVRESELGGHYWTALSINAKVTFTPVAGSAKESLQFALAVRFPSVPQPWQSTPTFQPKGSGFVLVDTDGDRAADTYLPGPSNFYPGAAGPNATIRRICHEGDDGQHCESEPWCGCCPC